MRKENERRPNIILISFDDCRADRLGIAGYKKNLTPFLDSLAGEGTYFSRAFATGSGSPQSFVGTLTSTYPMDHGGFDFIDKPRVLVSEALQEAGYKTLAVHSAAYMSGYFGYDRGWDTFRYLSHFDDGGTMPGIRRDTFQAKMLRRIAAARRSIKKRLPFLSPIFGFFEKAGLLFRKIINETKHFTSPFFLGNEVNDEIKKLLPTRPHEPLFLWVHYMDVHEPLGFFWRKGHGFWKKLKYHIGDLTLFMLANMPRLSRMFKPLYEELYDASVRSVDGHIGEMVACLRSRKVLSDGDILVVLSDHGEEFFEKGAFGHDQRPYNTNLHVPLIVLGPGVTRGAVVDRPVSLIDVSPTMLSLAHVEPPSVFRGKSLFNAEPRPVIAQIVDCDSDLSNPRPLGAIIIDQGYKLINYSGKTRLFSIEDLAEQHDVYALNQRIAQSLADRLAPYLSI